MAGKFIVIEGGDGAGKSSAVKYLKEQLAGEKVHFTREPGGTDAAEEIRSVLIKKRADPLDLPTQLFLCGAFRRDHVTKIIKPALAAGTHVICERFSASTYAYQITAGGGAAYKEFFALLDPLHRDNLEPDMTILLDVEASEGLARKKAVGDSDVFEDKEIAFHEAVRHGMAEYLAARPHVVIDASRPHEEVFAAVEAAVRGVLH